jgi:hypothetical protein
VLVGEVEELLGELVRHLDLHLHLVEGALREFADLHEIALEFFVGPWLFGGHLHLL